MKIGLLVLLFSFVFSVSDAPAQIMSNPGQWYINNQIYSTRVFNGVVANSMLRKGGGKSTRQNPPKNDRTTVDYTIFKASAGNILPKQLAANSKNGTGRETEQVFDSFISLYKQTARKDGFPPDDLAYAFEYFIVNNYQIYHDLIDLPADKDPRTRRTRDGFEKIQILNEKKLLQVSINQERAIYRQMKDLFSTNSEMQKMTDPQKQEGAEMMAILFGVNFSVYMKGVNDGNDRLTEQARQMAKEGLEKLLGASIDRIKITNNGLEIN